MKEIEGWVEISANGEPYIAEFVRDDWSLIVRLTPGHASEQHVRVQPVVPERECLAAVVTESEVYPGESAVIVPKEWIGRRVRVTLLDDADRSG